MPRFLLSLMILATVSACAPTGESRNLEVPVSGEFAEIDIEAQQRITSRLDANDPDAVAQVLESPDRYNPAVLYALAATLFRNDRPQEAAFWFYSGQIKARSDANKALDRSAHAAVSALNERFGSDINRWAFEDLERLRALVEAAVEADRVEERNYDPRWIALHGMDAFDAETLDFVDATHWAGIDEATRNDYLANFNRMMDSMSEQ